MRKIIAGLFSIKFFLILSVLFLVLMCMPGKAASAAELKFEQDSIVLYEGNTLRLNLIYDGQDFFQDSDEFNYDWYAYFESADPDIVRVYYDGSIDCMGTGKTVIKAYYNGLTAECTVKVKKNKFKLSETEITLYSNQSMDVKLSGIKKIIGYDYTTSNLDPDAEYSWSDSPKVEIKGNGVFTITAGKKGRHEIRLIGTNNKGVRYAKKLIVYTIQTGPEKDDISVAVGCSKSINMINSEITSVELVSWTEGNLFYSADVFGADGGYIVRDGFDSFSVKDTCPDETMSVFKIGYETEDGTQLYSYLNIVACDPEYVPFNEYLWVGQTYEPFIDNKTAYSEIKCTSSDKDILEIDDNGRLVPKASGNVTVKINVDGKDFKEELTVIDVHVSGNNIITWPGTKLSYKVTGAPSDMKITYKSSDPTVASISKKGTVKTKKKGFTFITVTVGDIETQYTVNVGDETAVKAVLYAGGYVGKAKYDQSKRMEEGYFDCSSLAWRSYAFAGLKITGSNYAPSSYDLAKYLNDNGYTIAKGDLSPEELLPGDLLFFSSRSYSDRFMSIDHVALYYGAVTYNEYYDFWSDTFEYGLQGSIVHAGTGGGGVYFSPYPGYSGAVLIARICK
ncbi:MAG: Ig-like domain-containing protein [Lachnospiraceae bacterium]|nr:Ig-like domain-containing protein [Lachnospiraceae bacterium]